MQHVESSAVTKRRSCKLVKFLFCPAYFVSVFSLIWILNKMKLHPDVEVLSYPRRPVGAEHAERLR